MFERLHQMFPASRVGFGEVGTDRNAPVESKQRYLERYYRLSVPVAGYIGGYFWWYYSEEMLPHEEPPMGDPGERDALDPALT